MTGKQHKRDRIKNIIFGTIVLMLLIALFGACTMNEKEDAPVDNSQTIQQDKDEKTSVDKAEKEIDEKAIEDKAAAEKKAQEDAVVNKQLALESEALLILQENFAAVGTVTFDSETDSYLITSSDPAFMQEVLGISNGTIPMSNWTTLVDSMVFLSESMQSILGDGYTIIMVNPENHDRYLLEVTDGVVVYDVFSTSI